MNFDTNNHYELLIKRIPRNLEEISSIAVILLYQCEIQ